MGSPDDVRAAVLARGDTPWPAAAGEDAHAASRSLPPQGLSKNAQDAMEKLSQLGRTGPGGAREAAAASEATPTEAASLRAVKTMFGQASWESPQATPAGKAAAEQAGAGAADAAGAPTSVEDPDLLPARPGRGWMWHSADATVDSLPRFPANIPPKLRRGGRGPVYARIAPVQVLKVKDRGAYIRESDDGKEKPRLVPAGMLIPWYEGVLLLACLEREASIMTDVQWHKEFSNIMEEERARSKSTGGALPVSLYAKQSSLTDIAITCSEFTDETTGKVWRHKRRIRQDTPSEFGEGAGEDTQWCIEGIEQYIPPWDAFCHPQCGVYQDFYMVKWAAPYSGVDYASTETGCPGAPGCTYEPDECLPVQLDGLRLAAKRAWMQEQQRKEEKAEEDHRKRRAVEQALARDAATPVEEPSPLKRARVGEDEVEARELWNAVARQGVQWQSIARSAEVADSFDWRPGGGSLGIQLGRAFEACILDRRKAAGRACLKVLFLAAAAQGAGAAESVRVRVAMQAACQLVRAGQVDMPALEENAGAMARSALTLEDADAAEGPLSAVAWAVALAFPTRADRGWGWQHQRWNWPAWWDFCARCLAGFRPDHAFRVLRLMLECMVKQDGGTLIHDMPTWKEDPARLRELRRRLCKTGGLDGEELLERLRHLGVD